MNIFLLDSDAVKAAQMSCDRHCVKMVLEGAQLLCSAFSYADNPPYKITHKNHPCSVWARLSKNNYLWLINHAKALASEYEFRFGKIHKSLAVVLWCEINQNKISFPKIEKTEHPQCFGDYKNLVIPGNPVQGYRNYYRTAKNHLKKYTKREIPEWWK